MPAAFTIGIAALIIILVILFFYFYSSWTMDNSPFFRSKIKIGTLIGMRLRRVVPSRIVNPMIKATKQD